MKQPKALTREQREVVSSWGLPWKDYAFVKYVGDFYMQIIHKDTGHMKIIDRKAKSRKGA